MRIDWLISGLGRGLRRHRWRIMMPEQAAEKARCPRRLRRLLGLLQLCDLRLGLLQRDVLHQYRLRQDVERIGILPERAVQQCFGIGVFLLKLGLIDLLDERVEKLFFLGSQRRNLRRPRICGSGRPSGIETGSSQQSCPAV